VVARIADALGLAPRPVRRPQLPERYRAVYRLPRWAPLELPNGDG
jgi:hypothetical protein